MKDGMLVSCEGLTIIEKRFFFLLTGLGWVWLADNSMVISCGVAAGKSQSSTATSRIVLL
jgi:hypothetical protein